MKYLKILSSFKCDKTVKTSLLQLAHQRAKCTNDYNTKKQE